ncbi:hypothetical protein HMPREF1548_02198 [Clostridium sp. KLE 1755]|nr:hypothetical protein HMPREF1548_02198 [Clostridium sp. KLE 1755]
MINQDSERSFSVLQGYCTRFFYFPIKNHRKYTIQKYRNRGFMKKILHDYLYYTNNSWLIAAASCMKEETMELKDGTITLTLPPMGAALITMYL